NHSRSAGVTAWTASGAGPNPPSAVILASSPTVTPRYTRMEPPTVLVPTLVPTCSGPPCERPLGRARGLALLTGVSVVVRAALGTGARAGRHGDVDDAHRRSRDT